MEHASVLLAQDSPGKSIGVSIKQRVLRKNDPRAQSLGNGARACEPDHGAGALKSTIAGFIPRLVLISSLAGLVCLSSPDFPSVACDTVPVVVRPGDQLPALITVRCSQQNRELAFSSFLLRNAPQVTFLALFRSKRKKLRQASLRFYRRIV